MLKTEKVWWEDCKVDIPEGRNGKWVIERFEIPEKDPYAFKFALQGRNIYPGTYTRLVRYNREAPEPQHDRDLLPGGTIVMSDTMAEIRDHMFVMGEVKRRGGRILIHGLGMGMFLKYVLSQPNVTHVDVIEIDQELIDLVEPFYQDERLEIHQGDCLTYKWPKGLRWNVVWHDIWDTISEDNRVEMTKLHRSFGNRCDYQESWCKSYLNAHRSSWW